MLYLHVSPVTTTTLGVLPALVKPDTPKMLQLPMYNSLSKENEALRDRLEALNRGTKGTVVRVTIGPTFSTLTSKNPRL